MQHLFGLLVGQHRLDPGKFLLVLANKIEGKEINPRHRHIRRHQLYLLGEGADALDGRQVPHRKGHDDDKIVVARLDVPQLFHPVAHEEVAARKIVAGKQSRRADAVLFHHPQNLDRAVPHAIEHHRFPAALQPLPHILLFQNPIEHPAALLFPKKIIA